MTEASDFCPERSVLYSLFDGGLSDEQQNEVGAHLESCPACQAALEEFAAAQAPWTGARWLNQAPAAESALQRVLNGARLESNAPPGQDGPDRLVSRLNLSFLEPTDERGGLGRLDHYDVIEVIGRGGAGVVLKAFDRTLQRVVAIKTPAPQLSASPLARKRFLREARAAAAVCHEHVVAIHSVQEANARPYLVMQYIHGVSLQTRLEKSGPLEVKEILRIGAQIASGLAAAHAHGLIHRDIKPANILLENGVERVKITDFGLARAVDDVSLTRTGDVSGTGAYMAPEQVRGELVDTRADLFSLGSVLYAMCTGHPPFRGPGYLAVLDQICEAQPQPIREINPEIPDWLTAIVEKLHAKAPEERFSSAAEVAELLNRHLAHLHNPAVASLPLRAECREDAIRRDMSKPRMHRSRAYRRKLLLLIPLLMLACFALAEATGVTQVQDLVATVLRISTPEGTLLVHVNDPDVKVTVEGNGDVVFAGAGAGLHEVRCKPGMYRLKATRNGEPVDLDSELITITRGGKELVTVRWDGSTEPVTQAAQKPFVVLGGAGVPERAHATLAEAVLGAAPGDTIEIRGNGPFLTPPLTIAEPLTIRAGHGCRPIIRVLPSTEGDLLYAQGALVLEGLEFQQGPQPQGNQGRIVRSSAPLAIVNCQLVGDGDYTSILSYSDLELRNCMILTPHNAVTWGMPSAQLRIDNCVLGAVKGGRLASVVIPDKPQEISIRLTRITSLSGWGLLATRWRSALSLPPQSAKPPMQIEITETVVAPSQSMSVLQFWIQGPLSEDVNARPFEKMKSQLPDLLEWREEDNLYAPVQKFCKLTIEKFADSGETESEYLDRSKWTTLFPQSEAHSLEGEPRFKGGNIRARLAELPENVTAEDFRLRPDSPGYRAGPDGKDLGADIDFVGPGEAYERWKKTPEYQQWRDAVREVLH